MELNYKASNIAKAERAEGKKFFAIFGNIGNDDVSVDDLLFIWKAGGGTEETFDELFAKGIPEVFAAIFDGVNRAGFLPNKIDTKAVKQDMMEAMTGNTKVSQNSGKTTKA
ncbi:hypothetical protein IKF23_02040 [Candidatus Saccharibacteria bacterium]|nr:hypothetical protein [Candidatus Saccharibacteria bacterium]